MLPTPSQRPQANFEVGDSQALRFPDGSFDAVRTERMLMHIPDPAKALRFPPSSSETRRPDRLHRRPYRDTNPTSGGPTSPTRTARERSSTASWPLLFPASSRDPHPCVCAKRCLRPKRNYRWNANRAARRNPARQRGRYGQSQRHARKGQRIVGRNAKQQAAHHVCRAQRT